MGTGAFSVLLLRLTEKRFSATQYALFSSLFGLPRLLAGPLTGFLVNAVGWRTFFLITLFCGVPGMVLLARFVPLGVREPEFTVEPPDRRPALSGPQLAWRGALGGGFALAAISLLGATLSALKTMRANRTPFNLGAALADLFSPADPAGWIQLAAVVMIATVVALFTAALSAARRGEAATDGP